MGQTAPDAREKRASEAGVIDRRTMITTAGAVVAGVVGVLALPQVATASTGDPVYAGHTADASGSDPGIYVRNMTDPFGAPGIIGESQSADGVQGFSHGLVDSGVWGKSYGADGAGVIGDGEGVGVAGRSTGGNGVVGTTGGSAAYGVFGMNTGSSGVGVCARANSGGTALLVQGRASFTRSGVASVAKNRNYVTIRVSDGLTTSSQFLVTLQGNAGSGVGVAYATRTGATTFRAYFTKKTTKSASVGWMVLG